MFSAIINVFYSDYFSDEEYLPKTNIINQKPTPDDRRTNHYAAVSHQTMYIMADLSDPVETTAAALVVVPQAPNERILCTIDVYSNGTIVMNPDFNEGKMAYIVETGDQNNQAFHYYLEHASTPINTEDMIRERKLLSEILSRRQTHRAQIVGTEFDTVRNNDCVSR